MCARDQNGISRKRGGARKGLGSKKGERKTKQARERAEGCQEVVTLVKCGRDESLSIWELGGERNAPTDTEGGGTGLESK